MIIIFICNYDPYNKGRVIYTFENICWEDPELAFGDETVKVIVNTKGTVEEISPELREVIQYLDSGAVTGTYSQELAEAVSAVKANEERRLEYMTRSLHLGLPCFFLDSILPHHVALDKGEIVFILQALFCSLHLYIRMNWRGCG